MSMWTTLDFPDRLPLWATNAGKTLDPDDATGITKEDGWVAGTRPSARVMNWLQNLGYLWTASQQGHVVSNWTIGATSGVLVNAFIYKPNLNRFIMTVTGATGVNYSDDDGTSWNAGTALAANSLTDVIGIDKLYVIVGNASNNLEYSTDGVAAWTAVTSATIGGSGTIFSLCTKYPTDNYIMLVRGSTNAAVRYASAVTSTWNGTTLGNPANTLPRTLLHLYGTTWAIFVHNINNNQGELAKVYISTDDGANWAASSAIFPAGSVGALNDEQMSYNPNTGRLVVAGAKNVLASPADNVIYYSDDLGTTWTEATIYNNRPNTALYNLIKSIYYCGGTTWIAGLLGYAESATDNVVYVSTDDGISWFPGGLGAGGFTNTSTDKVHWIAASERQVLFLGRAGASLGKTFASTRIVPFELNSPV